MSYKITIEETKMVDTEIGNKWEVLRSVSEHEDERGYTPSKIVPREETERIFEQVVGDVDLVKVILAINSCAE